MEKITTFNDFINESSGNVKKVKFKNLKIKDGVKSRNEVILYLPTGEDSKRTISTREGEYAEPHLEDYKKEMIKRYPGIENATVIIDPNEVWFNQVQIDWKPLLKAEDRFVKGKAATLKAWGTTE